MTVNSSPTNIYNNNNDNNNFYFQRLNTFTEGIFFFLYATGEKKLEIVIKDNDGNDDNNKTYFFQAYVR